MPTYTLARLAPSVRTLTRAAGGGSTPPVYAQRVWSTGLGAWCSWIGPIDSSPTPAMTTPNWTGSITSYECVSRRLN